MSKREITYRKVTRERFIELLGRIGYRVTRQSSDGFYQLIRPAGVDTSIGYWLLPDHLEHRLDDFRGGSYFYYKECLLKDNQMGTISLVAKNNPSVFVSFHNFTRVAQEPRDD